MSSAFERGLAKYMATIGSKGGATRGRVKARTSEQASLAAKARWAKTASKRKK